MTTRKEKPYVPKYKGFDEAATERAHKTAQRAQEGAGAKGEDANKEYVDDGPAEYDRRTKDDGKRMKGKD